MQAAGGSIPGPDWHPSPDFIRSTGEGHGKPARVKIGPPSRDILSSCVPSCPAPEPLRVPGQSPEDIYCSPDQSQEGIHCSLCPCFKQKPRYPEPRTFALDHRPKAKPRAIPQVSRHVRDMFSCPTEDNILQVLPHTPTITGQQRRKKAGPSCTGKMLSQRAGERKPGQPRSDINT